MTIATYQVVTTKRKGVYPHLELFDARDWGLIVYDEVHLLPAPIFRMTADLQARRRLGLTATLVREDGREGDVFSLIGPKRYDAPWKDIEAQGYIAPADCVEVRVTLPDSEPRVRDGRGRRAVPAVLDVAGAKSRVVEKLVAQHQGEPTLVIGQYIDQLDDLGHRLDAPVIKGDTTVKERQRLFEAFRHGEISPSSSARWRTSPSTCPRRRSRSRSRGPSGPARRRPSASAACWRPKGDHGSARFYTVVSRDTKDQDFAAHRQRFLAEQGYAYRIVDADDIDGGVPDANGVLPD